MMKTPVETARAPTRSNLGGMAIYLLLGVLFGVVLTKSEVISWFRIQEMFRFQAFHMYGIIGSAILVAAIGFQVIRRSGCVHSMANRYHFRPRRWVTEPATGSAAPSSALAGL